MSNVSSATVADPRLLKAGFAKLRGDEIDFIMRSYEITLGRATTGPPTTKTADVGLGDTHPLSHAHPPSSYHTTPHRHKHTAWMHVRRQGSQMVKFCTAGSNLNISRQHAKIHYNFDKGPYRPAAFSPKSRRVLPDAKCCMRLRLAPSQRPICVVSIVC